MSGSVPRGTRAGKKIIPPRDFARAETVTALADPSATKASSTSFVGRTVLMEPDKRYGYPVMARNGSYQTSYSSISDIESWGNSSSSSMSWCEEYDSGVTHKINEDLENIETVLYQEADFSVLRPDLQAECREWMDAFPHLRIKGLNIRNKSFGNTDDVKQSEKTYRVLTPKYSGQPNLNFRIRSSQDSLKPTGDYIESESFLRISPAPYYEPQPPIHSGTRLDAPTSKWHRAASPEYSSLPYIPAKPIKLPTDVYTPRKPTRNHPQPIINESHDHYQTLPVRHKPLVLPPIEQMAIAKPLGFRSISATPRKSTLLSSMKDAMKSSTSRLFASQRKLSENNLLDKTNMKKPNY